MPIGKKVNNLHKIVYRGYPDGCAMPFKAIDVTNSAPSPDVTLRGRKYMRLSWSIKRINHIIAATEQYRILHLYFYKKL